MKTLNFSCRAARVACSLFLVSALALIAEPAAFGSEQAGPQTGPSIAAPQPKLPYGVEEVLKLSRAQISEDVIVNYIQNSGTVYSLSSSDILYLRKEGVSDRVINAMLEQRQRLAASSQNQAAAAPPPTAATAPAPVEQPAAPANPAPVYVQPPSEPAPSTVYVIPYPPASSAYYGYYQPYPYPYPYSYGYGYYGPYYYGPSISLGFGFGGYRGGHYGGWHGHYGGHYGGHRGGFRGHR